jgi:hypothetical protein
LFSVGIRLPQVDTRIFTFPDGSFGSVKVHAPVIVVVSLNDGNSVQTSVIPISFQEIDECVGVRGAVRILGHSTLFKMNLKIHYPSKRLVKFIRRI